MDEQILIELVTGICAAFEKQVIRIILYGSVARGTETAESDVDIAVLIHGNMDEQTEERLSAFVVEMNLKYDRVFSVIDIDYSDYTELENISPFYQNLKQEGIVLWNAA